MTHKYQSTAQPVQHPAPPPTYSDRQFLHTSVAGALLPLVQAFITGILVFLASCVLFYMFDVMDWVKYAAVTGLLTILVVWIYMLRRWVDLTGLEKFLNLDLNQDDVIGEPPQRVTITVNRVKENKHIEQMSYAFPVSDQQIARFFTTVKTSTRGGKSISRRQWTPKHVHGFSEGEWDAFFAELAKQRLITNRNKETVLTPEGEEIADGWYARTQPPPSPTDQDA